MTWRRLVQTSAVRAGVRSATGDYSDHGRFMPLVHFTMRAALDEGLWPACTDVVRLQYHNSSSKKTYRSSFIPGVHDTCLVFQRDS